MPLRIAAILADAHAAWPGILVPDAQFAAFLASKSFVESTRFSDLYIAFAASLRDPDAARAIEEAHSPALRKALAGLRLGQAQIDDVLQSLWRDLFATDPPRISQFDGSGDLKSWLRVAATRAGLRVLKKSKREVPESEISEIAEKASGDPELMLLKAQYRADFHAAVETAIENMNSANAMILRQHFVDGLSIDELGKLYALHRATAARRLANAKQMLVASIRTEFKKKAKLDDDECESVLRLVRSGLDITLRRHFVARK
jgi:RNA polymerase sigma-70 factor (ECF subfamily)